MLSLHALHSPAGKGADEIVRYMTQADYYTKKDTTAGIWHGAGCEDFGLQAGGKVDAEQFRHLLRGYDKDGAVYGRQKPADDHAPGIDMTFSSPKSVSIAWAAANPEMQAEIDQILLKARKEALDYAVERGLFVMRTEGRPPARPMFAIFSHNSSREHDMQKHFHVVGLNASKDADGVGHSIDMANVWRAKKEIGAVMRAFEARAFQAAGATIERDGQSYRLVMFPEGRKGNRGITPAVERYFSKGLEKIEAILGPYASAQAKAAVAQAVRNQKTGEDPAVADRRWKDEIFAASGMDAEAIKQCFTEPQKLSNEANCPRFDLTEIIDRLTEKGVYFRESDLRAEIAIAAQGVYDVEIKDLIKQAINHERLVRIYSTEESDGAWIEQTGGFDALSETLRKQAEASYEKWSFVKPELAQKYNINEYVTFTQGKTAEEREALIAHGREPKTVKRTQFGWTTRETLMADLELARYAQEASQGRNHVIDKAIVDKAIEEFEAMKRKERPDFKISPQQRAAIYHMTMEGDIAIVEGVAGAGKSTFLFPVSRAYEKAGYTKVIGVSFQNTNSTDLGRDAEIESYTIDKILALTRPGPRKPGEKRLEIDDKTVIILDEAGQVGGLKMHALQRLVEKAGAKFLLSGHTAQKQAITGTAAMKLMREQAGPSGSIWITETQRQEDQTHGEALTKLSEGDAVDALVIHAAAGRFIIAEGEGFKEAAAAYHRRVEELGVDRAFVLADTNRSMRHANEEIRKSLKTAGVVAEHDYTVTLTDKKRNEYETKLSVGDRVITRTKVQGEKAIQNGIVWAITDIDEVEPGRLIIGMKRADGAPVDATGRDRVVIDTHKTKNFHLSYAMTVDLSQGKTKEDGVKLETDASRAEMTQEYVGLSRYREVPYIIVTEHYIKELAILQGRQVENPRDIKEAARVYIDGAEDMSKMKSHSLDAAYALPEGFKFDKTAAAQGIAEFEKRQQEAILAEKAGEAVDYARINEETAAMAVKNGRKAQGADNAAPLSKDGRLEEAERGKLALEGEAALAQTPEQIAEKVAALTGAKGADDFHAKRAAAKAEQQAKAEAEKATKRAAGRANRLAQRQAQQEGEQQEQPARRDYQLANPPGHPRHSLAAMAAERQAEPQVQPAKEEAAAIASDAPTAKTEPQQEQNQAAAQPHQPVRQRRSLAELASQAKAAGQERYKEELAEKAREGGLIRIGRELDRAETAWRKLPADAPAEQIAIIAGQKEQARSEYRGLLSTDAECQRWDYRNIEIDRIDAAVTPASQRQAELHAQAEELARQAEEASQHAEAARQNGFSLSR